MENAIEQSAVLDVVPVNRSILKDAAGLRARTGIKWPDAIHLATALFTGCDGFVTNDSHLLGMPDIEVLLLSEISV